MDKREFLDHVITTVRTLSLSAVMSTRMQLIQRGRNFKGLCPFHNDKSLGSFVVTDSKNIWKCFSCGVGGDAVKFISLFDNINYVEAAFKLALEYNLITDYEYRKYFERSRYSKEQINRVIKKFEAMDKERLKNNIADTDTLNDVFSIFLQSIEEYYTNNKDYEGLLSKKHKNYLMTKRELSITEIQEGSFFTYPSKWVMKRFTKKIRNKYGSDTILAEIPGFYKEIEKDYFTMVGHRGIGIPIKNAKDQIVGIQVRREDVNQQNAQATPTKKESRYVWLSSSFATFDDKYECGTSSGSPVDVVFPSELKNSTVFITEGRFKAMKLAKEKGSIVLSVQGVSTWKGVLAELQTLSTMGHQIDCIMIAFDADMNCNYAVFSQARRMTEYLQKNGYFVYYLTWDERLGKGIDDLIINGNIHAVKKYLPQIWNQAYDQMVNTMINNIKAEAIDNNVRKLLEANNVQVGSSCQIKDIPTEVFQIYFNQLMTQIPPLLKGVRAPGHIKLKAAK